MTIDKIQAPQKIACRWRVRLGALALALLPFSAQAISVCTVTTIGAQLGNYIFSNTSPTHVTGNVAVSCLLVGVFSVQVSYSISLSTGSNTSYAPRKMTSVANWLQYNLYTDENHTTIWGDGTPGTSTVSDSYLLGILPTVRNYAVYGQIPSGQNVPVGIYLDTIAVTVNY
jgi:spore coat protein U-like protein